MSKTQRTALLLATLLQSVLVYAQGPDFTPQTPLLGAAMRNDTAAVQTLLRANANPNEGQLMGMGPIFFAIGHQNTDMLRMLVKSGANIMATDREGSTTLMHLLGLAWSHADPHDLRSAARGLIMQQRQDGGWAQLPTLETDAYATGQALVALLESEQVTVMDPVVRRGMDYLLRTQDRDGSWLVRSRAFPFQKYRDGGFPHGKDQFISAAGTSWAVMALSLAIPEASSAPQPHSTGVYLRELTIEQ